MKPIHLVSIATAVLTLCSMPAQAQKTSALTEATSADSADILRFVDVSDKSLAATGSDKRITIGDLSLALPTLNASALAIGTVPDARLSSNVLFSTGSYANPVWLTALSWSKLTGMPTTLAGFGITDAQPLDSDLTSIAALSTTAFGRGLLSESSAASLRLTLGLGGASLLDVGTAAGTVAAGDHIHDDRYYTESEVDTLVSNAGGVTPEKLPSKDVVASRYLRHAYDKIYRLMVGGELTRLNIGILGDSIGNSLMQYLTPLFQRAIGSATPTTVITITSSGDAIIPDGSTVAYDYTVHGLGKFVSLGSGTGTFTWSDGGGAVTANRIAFYYIKEPGAGVFKLQRNTTNSITTGWVDEPGYEAVDCNSASFGYGKIVLTPPVGRNTIRAVHVSGGRTRVVEPIYTDTTQKGVVIRYLNRGGHPAGGWKTWNESGPAGMAVDYIAEMDLDLATWMGREASSTLAPELVGIQTLFDTARSTTDWIYMESAPLSPPQDEASQADLVAQNAIVRAHAETYGKFCFDGYTPVISTAEVVALDWDGDGVHMAEVCNHFLASLLYQKIRFLFENTSLRNPLSFAVTNGHVQTALTMFGDQDDPWLKWYDSSAGVLALQWMAAANSAGSKNFFDILDSTGAKKWRFSFHSSVSNPSQAPDWLGFVATATYGLRALSDELSLRATYNGNTSAFLSALNAPRSTEVASTTIVGGRSYIAANGTQTFTLPSSGTVGQITRVTGRNASWVIAQPASVIIRSGSNATTAGTGGSLSGGQYDSVTLECVNTTEWRVIASSPGSTFTWN